MVGKHRTMKGPTQKKKTGCNFARKDNNAGGARGQGMGRKKRMIRRWMWNQKK